MGISLNNIIYFDNAATTFPKPTRVINETVRVMTECGGNAGRGAHYYSREAAKVIYETREILAEFFGSKAPENVIFTLNTTYALNIAVKSLARKGMHILISDMEHNSVLRPLEALTKSHTVSYSVFSTDFDNDDKIIDGIGRLMRDNTGMLVCQFGSNICGKVLPIKRIGELCKQRGIHFIVDAAQGAGHYDIDIEKIGISAVCFPSHKGLYGPQGCGVVIFSEKVGINSEDLSTIVEGGSGSSSLDRTMPVLLPDRFESGTMPAPIISALGKGVGFVKALKTENIRKYEEHLGKLLTNDLMNMKHVKVYSPNIPSAIVLFNVLGKSSVNVADYLDGEGICTRSGFHCAPLAHRTLNTGKNGAVRISFGVFNAESQVRKTVDIINRIKA